MRHLADDRGARIEVLVNAVAEAHEAERVVLVLGLREVLVDLADVADLVEHLEHGLVGPAVRGPPQRRDACRDRRVRVCAGASGHAHRRRRAVLLVVRVQDEQQVQRLGLDRVDLVGLGGHGKHHLQEVCRVIEFVLRIHERLAGAQLVSGCRDRRQLGDDTVREDIAVLRIMNVRRVVIVRGHGADNGRQHRHGMGVVAETLEEVEHALVEHGVRADRGVEFLEFARRRQLAIEQQVADLDEVRMFGKLFDRVAPVHQDALFAIDEGYVRFAASRRDEARVVGKHALVTVQASDIDDVRAGSTLVDRQFQFATVRIDQSKGFLGHGNPFVVVGGSKNRPTRIPKPGPFGPRD